MNQLPILQNRQPNTSFDCKYQIETIIWTTFASHLPKNLENLGEIFVLEEPRDERIPGMGAFGINEIESFGGEVDGEVDMTQLDDGNPKQRRGWLILISEG
ncbi:hypothetical protein U1Q18_007942 [Sarracenia purpurea var. burkii]